MKEVVTSLMILIIACSSFLGWLICDTLTPIYKRAKTYGHRVDPMVHFVGLFITTFVIAVLGFATYTLYAIWFADKPLM